MKNCFIDYTIKNVLTYTTTLREQGSVLKKEARRKDQTVLSTRALAHTHNLAGTHACIYTHTHTHPPLLGIEENQYVFE